MPTKWEKLSGRVGRVVANLNYLLKSHTVGVFLVEQIEWLEMVVREKPKNEVERDALIMTIKDARDVFAGYAEQEDECGNTDSSYWLRNAHWELYVALGDFDD